MEGRVLTNGLPPLTQGIIDSLCEFAHRIRALDIAGDVRGRPVLIIDDMITTGATIEAAAGLLRVRGAGPDITVAATHGLLVHAAVSRLRDLDLRRALVSDTVAPKNGAGVIEVCSIAPTLALAIACLHSDTPLGRSPTPHSQ